MAGWDSNSKDGRIATFAEKLKEAEKRGEGYLPTAARFQLAKAILTGEPFDEGKPPYIDFVNLILLRDSLVHMKADTFEYMSKKNVRRKFNRPMIYLARKGLIKTDRLMDRISIISSPAVAQWACNSASIMIRSIIEAFPSSSLKRHWKMLEPAFPVIE